MISIELRRSEKKMQQPLTCVEICAGAGGQALGLAMAGFVHVALVEYEEDYCKVLKQNRPEWNVICADVHDFDGRPYHGVDLLLAAFLARLSPLQENSSDRKTKETFSRRPFGLSKRFNRVLSCLKTSVVFLIRALMNTATIFSRRFKSSAM